MNLTRRAIFTPTLAALVVTRWPRLPAAAAAEELKVPDNVPVDKFDFEAKGIEGWTTVDGQWAVEDMAVVRANALEGNFRLYYYDRGRRQLASASGPRSTTTDSWTRRGSSTCTSGPTMIRRSSRRD